MSAARTISAIAEDRRHKGNFPVGATLREILEVTDCRPFSACAGNGFCGMCRVEVEGGAPSAPTQAEQLTLSPTMLESGLRLACQTRVHEDVTVRVLNPHPSTEWRTPEPESLCTPDAALFTGALSGLGLAVDLGTTHLTVSLVDRDTGQRRAARTGINRQNMLGADNMTRLQQAAETPELRRRATTLARETVRDAITDLCLGNGLNPHKIRAASIVGNTAMILLLMGGDPALLLDPENWGLRLPLPPVPGQELALEWNLAADTEWIVPPFLSGFVGSDALAGIMATRVYQSPRATAFVDFGTNSESALWHKGTLWVTSAAGGPAFEGSGLGCGAAARRGAIHGVCMDSAGNLQCEVLGNDVPVGLCGSGLVDLLAVWLETGIIDSLGRFQSSPETTSRRIFPELPSLELSRHDIDMLQRAKAAVAAGLRRLLDAAAIEASDIAEFHIGGAFGRYLNPASARRIGLLPDLPDGCFVLGGNTALAGAEALLAGAAPAETCAQLLACTRGLNLGVDPAFERLFLASLFLQPWGATKRTKKGATDSEG